MGLSIGVDLSPEANRRCLGLGTQQQVDTAALVNATLTKLQDALDIHRQGLTYLIAISVSSPSPTRSAEIANLYAKTYIEAQVSSKTASLLGARDVLQRQLATAQKDLSSSETAVNAFIEANLTRLEKESGDPAIAQSRRQLEAAKADQAAVAAKISAAQTSMSAKDWGMVTQTLGYATLAELDRQRVEATQKLDRARAGTAEALDLAAELARVESSLASRSTVSLAAAQSEVLDLGKREASARDQLRSGLLQSDLSAEMLTELFNLQQSATLTRNQYQTLVARKQDLATLANLQISDARIVSAAPAPGRPRCATQKDDPDHGRNQWLGLWADAGLSQSILLWRRGLCQPVAEHHAGVRARDGAKGAPARERSLRGFGDRSTDVALFRKLSQTARVD